MDKSFLPHHQLFDELQIVMTQIVRELPVVNSMLKWTKATLDREALPINLGWMLSNNLSLSQEKQAEKLNALRLSIQELSPTIKELMRHILQFSRMKPIEKALIAFHKSYVEIPLIDNEINLLCLGSDLFENRELLSKLLLFTEKLLKLQEASTHLKKALIDTLLQNLSLNFEKASTPESTTN